jgi:hypothetical protein
LLTNFTGSAMLDLEFKLNLTQFSLAGCIFIKNKKQTQC